MIKSFSVKRYRIVYFYDITNELQSERLKEENERLRIQNIEFASTNSKAQNQAVKMALLNRNLRKNCETIFMMPTLKNSFVSSTLIKEVARLNGDFEPYVPPPVAAALRKKLGLADK